MLVSVDLRNIGWVRGSVAWVQDNRFGIAFADEIDPKLARQQTNASAQDNAQVFTRPLLPADRPVSPDKLRKI